MILTLTLTLYYQKMQYPIYLYNCSESLVCIDSNTAIIKENPKTIPGRYWTPALLPSVTAFVHNLYGQFNYLGVLWCGVKREVYIWTGAVCCVEEGAELKNEAATLCFHRGQIYLSDSLRSSVIHEGLSYCIACLTHSTYIYIQDFRICS